MAERENNASGSSLILLSNGVFIPNKEILIKIHEEIIKYRKSIGRTDPDSIRNEGVLDHLCDSLKDRLHKYKNNPLENAIYIASETFYYIACQHPFSEGNKSTAYVSALLLLSVNQANTAGLMENKKNLRVDKVVWALSVPKESEEITKLADSGAKEEFELKKLIKELLAKQSGVNQ